MATSAWWSTSSTSCAPSCAPLLTATPTLAVTHTSCPRSRNGSASTATIRAATASAACWSTGCSSRIANSSPPSRASVSSSRTQPRSRPATPLSSSSPAACPSPSLTTLKSSKSRNRAAKRSGWRVRRASVWTTRSRNSARLASPVSGSCSAWYSRRPSSLASWRWSAWLSSRASGWRPTTSSTSSVKVQYREGTALLVVELLTKRDHHRQREREIRKQDPGALARAGGGSGGGIGSLVVCGWMMCGRIVAKSSSSDQQIPSEPAHISHKSSVIGPGLGEVGKRAVGDRQAQQGDAKQRERHAASAAGEHNQHDGGHDDIPDRVGKGDQLLNHTTRRRPKHRAEHQRPARIQQGGGDQAAVQHPTYPRGGPLLRPGSREAQHGGHGQRHRAKE